MRRKKAKTLTEICSIRFDSDLLERVRIKAKSEGRPFANYVRWAVAQSVKDVVLDKKGEIE